MAAVADVISAGPKTCQKADEDIAVLRQELAALKAEVAELRGNSGFAARLMALRSGWPNWRRHWYGSRLLAHRRTRVAAVAAAAVVVLAVAVVILPMPR